MRADLPPGTWHMRMCSRFRRSSSWSIVSPCRARRGSARRRARRQTRGRLSGGRGGTHLEVDVDTKPAHLDETAVCPLHHRLADHLRASDFTHSPARLAARATSRHGTRAAAAERAAPPGCSAAATGTRPLRGTATPSRACPRDPPVARTQHHQLSWRHCPRPDVPSRDARCRGAGARACPSSISKSVGQSLLMSM
jgi:hypothetical protein